MFDSFFISLYIDENVWRKKVGINIVWIKIMKKVIFPSILLLSVNSLYQQILMFELEGSGNWWHRIEGVSSN